MVHSFWTERYQDFRKVRVNHMHLEDSRFRKYQILIYNCIRSIYESFFTQVLSGKWNYSTPTQLKQNPLVLQFCNEQVGVAIFHIVTAHSLSCGNIILSVIYVCVCLFRGWRILCDNYPWCIGPHHTSIPPPPFRPHPLSDLDLLVATTSGYSAMCKEKLFLILIQNVINNYYYY